jgi:signal transduction histidine kinase
LPAADPAQLETALKSDRELARRDAIGWADRYHDPQLGPCGQHGRRAHGAVAGDYVEIAVADTGHGIAPELRDRVFEPFFTTKHSLRGSGWGLSQVQGFARQLGGDVLIDSTLGAGTRVRMLLPRAHEERPIGELVRAG